MDTISRTDLQMAIAAGDVTVVETLGPLYYDEAHLPGAVNLPHTEVRAFAPTLLPDKDAFIVTYCSNSDCRNSQIALDQLRAMGYTNVRKYAEGKQDWIAAGLPTESAVPA